MKNLSDYVVVVTGGSTGIGLETARLFGKAGSRVAIIGRTQEKLDAAKKSLQSSQVEALTVATDVTSEAGIASSFEEIEKQLGPVDILVNNAGVGFATDLSKCSIEDYRKIVETNLTGAFLCVRAVLAGMKTRKRGHIINVSSIVGKVSNPTAPLYCASKHALNGYTAGLQLQVAGDGVRVSLVSPSSVDTAYWDGRPVDRTKFLQAEEVASVIYFVAAQPDGVLIKDIDLTSLR